MTKMFRVSATALDSYFTCPARYDFQRRMRPLKISSSLKDGLDAHSMVEGKPVPDASKRAKKWATGFRALERGFIPVVREVKQVFPINKTIELARRIDLLALEGPALLPSIVDFKGTDWGWKTIGDTAYKAETFQSAAYIIKPPPDMIPEEFHGKWPGVVHYLVSDGLSGKEYRYFYNEDDIKNLREAAVILSKAKKFPKHRGNHCSFCPFDAPCFDVKGWEDWYELAG